jgi:hypothetical protein
MRLGFAGPVRSFRFVLQFNIGNSMVCFITFWLNGSGGRLTITWLCLGWLYRLLDALCYSN